MVLFAFAGELGSGKTISAVFLTWKNWYTRHERVYANINLFKIPYMFVDHVSQLFEMEYGIVLADELWLIADSRMSRTSGNRFTANILSRSRKKHLNFFITTQLLDSLDKRIRKVLDFSASPVLNRNETVMKVLIFRTGFPTNQNYMKSFYFYTEPVMGFYDTDQEVKMIDDMAEPVKKQPPIIFQPNFDPEHGYCCQCERCGTMFFDTWEEADKYAEQWWEDNMKDITIQ